MVYPQLLVPTTTEALELPSGKVVHVPKTTPSFSLWKGNSVDDTYGGKAILSFEDKPAFAELVVLNMFRREGWDGVWVDTFRNKFRTEYWPANEVELPKEAHDLLQSINTKNGSNKGCWDVYCWKGWSFIFIECKANGKDAIRETQRKWLASAIQFGLALDSFLIVEWSASKKRLPN